MTKLNEDVLALVEREVRKDPSVTSGDLMKKAVKIDKRVESLSGRQFHAQYALQVRRRLSTPPRRKKRSVATESAQELLSRSFEDKKAELDSAIADAFQRAIDSDSLSSVNKLLSALDREARRFEKLG